MLKQLLYKEWRLVLHPTNLIFLSFSAMLLIPNYPYYIIFFYTGLSIFFLSLNARENHDLAYTLMLPVTKRSMVYARMFFVVQIELIQMLLAIPFAVLRRIMLAEGNLVGMDANIAFFGLSFVMLGIFNWVFFIRFFSAPAKVGRAFLLASSALMVFILLAETLTHTLPLFRDQLDTPDPSFLSIKLLFLGLGIGLYLLMTWRAAIVSARRFDALDLP